MMRLDEFLNRTSGKQYFVLAYFTDMCALGYLEAGEITWAKDVNENNLTEMYAFNENEQYHVMIEAGLITAEECVDDTDLVVLDKDMSVELLMDQIYQNPDCRFAYDDLFYVTGNEFFDTEKRILTQQGRFVELPEQMTVEFDFQNNPLRLKVRNYIEKMEVNGVQQMAVLHNRLVSFTTERKETTV